MRTALVFGATGFVGSFLLQQLLQDPLYGKVIAVVRNAPEMRHEKLMAVLGDLAALPSLKAQLVADDVYIALGTTRAKTPDQAIYYQVDHDYPLLAATIARENGASRVLLVSSVGANTASSVFYLRTKGELERDLLALNFPVTGIFRPGLIMGKRSESRPAERIFQHLFALINPILGNSRYHGIPAEDIATVMRYAAKNQQAPATVYHWKEMNALLNKRRRG